MNKSSPPAWQRKLSRSLNNFLHDNAGETRSVLIALVAPLISISDAKSIPVRDLRGRKDIRFTVSNPTINPKETQQIILNLLAPEGHATDIMSIGDGYFTASVTREQLKQLASLPGVQTISENMPSVGPAASPQRSR